MSVATLLTQPKLVAKLQSPPSDETLAEDVIVLVRRIIANTEKSQFVLLALQNGVQQFAENFLDNAADVDGGLRQLEAMAAPLMNEVRSLSELELEGNELVDIPRVVEIILDKFIALTDVVANVTINDIRQLVSELLSILTTKFGFSLENVVDQVWVLFDTVITELKTFPIVVDIEDSIDIEERELRLATASILGKIKRQVQDVVELPELNTDDISNAIMSGLRDFGLDGWIQFANEIGEALKATFAAAGSIAEIIDSFSGDVGASVGAAARAPDTGDKYCWYASWALATRRRTLGDTVWAFVKLGPNDEVWVTADRTQVIWRTVFDGDICLHEGVDVNWYDAPMFSAETEEEYLLFNNVSHSVLEGLAKASYMVVEVGKGMWNLIDASSEAGDRASATTHSIWNMFNCFFAGPGDSPFNSYLTTAAGWGQEHQGWLGAIFPVLGTLIPSIEGRQTEADQDGVYFWGILLGDDILERAGHHMMLNLARDLLLSTLTLANNFNEAQGDDDSHPINKEYTSVWANVGATICTVVLFKTIYKKEDYHFPFDGGLWSFATGLAGLCGGLAGSLFGSAIAGAKVSVGGFFVDIGFETAKGLATYYVSAYFFAEGDTEGGTFNRGKTDVFAGYPDNANSPYKLPFARDEVKVCVQGNQGMWSHFSASNQLYAVDFGFDQGEEIVAVRSGTVVFFSEDTENDEKQKDNGDDRWNHIIIRHDVAESAEVGAAHDTYHDGNEYITYAIYGHGRHNGVSEIFAARDSAVASSDIVGTTVLQGEPIMKAGNTGVSFHNHLHLQIQTHLEPPGTVVADDFTLNTGQLVSDTIPFVFQEVDGGVVKSLTFYTSENGPE
ncbi:MAG: M23 family metallopeptidase [Pseudomonadales bacterium]|nr:M23 family metallopeptidase [Pseudomonadales bacterium]